MNERHDDLQEIVDAALREMAAEEGDGFDPQACNLAEFCRRTGLTRSRARTVRAHGFRALPHGNSGRRAAPGVLAGHTGLRLLQDPGPGRGRAGQAPVAGRPLRAPQRRLRRARRHREDAPRAGLRARVLHAGAQDLLHKGDRAQGQVPEGRPAGKHLAGRLLARQAVVPHR